MRTREVQTGYKENTPPPVASQPLEQAAHRGWAVSSPGAFQEQAG